MVLIVFNLSILDKFNIQQYLHKDLKELNIYSKVFSIDKCLKKYVLLINRGNDSTLGEIRIDNGVTRRSIIIFNLLESIIEQFCYLNDYELKSIISEDLDI